MAPTSHNQILFASESDNETRVEEHEDTAGAVSSSLKGKEERTKMERNRVKLRVE